MMSKEKLLNRDVFILIDKSASMIRIDSENYHVSRWQLLAEIVQGHTNSLLEETIENQKICTEVYCAFFSRNRSSNFFIISSSRELENYFLENQPDSNTFICPTLQTSIQMWNNGGRKHNKGLLIIIYTDGMLDDKENFVNLISQFSKTLESQEQAKIIMVGIGSDISRNPQFYLDIDFNLKNNKDSRGNLCNIFVFELADEIDSIREVIMRQLSEDPSLYIPEWVQKNHPEFYHEYMKKLR